MTSHSQIIAKNTIFLYIRTIVIMLISLYTSRVLLDKLGVDNFGIYNLVGGVVLLFASLKGVFAQSVQRFLNYEKGKGDHDKVNDIFNISLFVHLVLGIIFITIVILFGVWYIPKYLVLPPGTMDTAMFVFYCSLFSTLISIATIPYDSVIIANEKFNFYAVISMVEGVLKLGIVYLLGIVGSDMLRAYALLITGVTISIRVIYIVYALQFRECSFKRIWNKKIFIDLATFSGWNFLGNVTFSLTNEGINFVLNSFGGVVANASRGIAYQVKSAVLQLSGNIIVASRPYISEIVASKGKEIIFGYIIKVSRVVFLIIALTSLPIVVYAEQILNFWLVEIPEYSVIFVQLVMVHIVIRSPQAAIDLLFSAYGEMKHYQIVQSFSLFLSLPLSFILLKIGFPLYWAFISMCVAEAITLIGILICAKKKIGFLLTNYIKHFCVMAVLASASFSMIGILFRSFVVPSSIVSLLICMLTIVVLGALIAYFFFLNKEEKELVKLFIDRIKK